MAGPAVVVGRELAGRRLLDPNLVQVRVVSEVAGLRRFDLVIAIHGSARPRELQGQQQCEEENDSASHDGVVSGMGGVPEHKLTTRLMQDCPRPGQGQSTHHGRHQQIGPRTSRSEHAQCSEHHGQIAERIVA